MNSSVFCGNRPGGCTFCPAQMVEVIDMRTGQHHLFTPPAPSAAAAPEAEAGAPSSQVPKPRQSFWSRATGRAGPSQGSAGSEATRALTLPLAQTPYVKVTTLTGVCAVCLRSLMARGGWSWRDLKLAQVF